MTLRRAILTLAAGLAMAAGSRAAEPDLSKTFAELLPALDQEQAQQRWQEICWQAGAPGHEADRATACALMAAKLGPQSPAPARIWLLKQLERIGKAESVEAVSAVLGDPDHLVHDAAVRALANNPDPAAGDRLRAALSTAREPAHRIAIINALGFRKEAASVAVLTIDPAAGSDDPALLAATARALGRIATPASRAALLALHGRCTGPARLQVGDALARQAHALLRQGRPAEARAIYDLLNHPAEPAHLAGLEGVLQAAGDDAPALVLDVLAHGDRDEAEVAVGSVSRLQSPGILRLAEGLPGLPPEAQPALLIALGAKRDRAALPAVAVAAGRDDPRVRVAALAALGGVGDASTVPLLLKAVQDGGDAARVARRSLETVFADGVDAALIADLKGAGDNGPRALLIEILDNRRASEAVPAFLGALASDDGNVRRRAIAALGHVAGDADIPAMVQALLAIKDVGERDEAAGAVASVCGRIADEAKRAEPVLGAYRNASPPDQLALLPLLGRIGGTDALVVVREAVAAAEEPRRKAGELALLSWPDSAVAEDVARLVEATKDEDTRTRAIQVLARVAVQPGPFSDDARLGLLKRGFDKAGRNEEKRLLLDRAREVHTFAAVKFAADHIGEPKLASQAIATAVDLLHRDEIRNPNQAEADKILDQVIAASKDKSLIERAKSFKKAR